MGTQPPPWPVQGPPPPEPTPGGRGPGGQDPGGRPPGRRAIRIGVALMVLGVLGGIALIAVSVSSFVNHARPQPVDGETIVRTDAGDEYVVYRIGGTAAASECSITGPDGRSVRLDPSLSAATLTVGDTDYVPLRVFETDIAGDHVVVCASPPGQLAVGPEIPLFRNVALILSGVFGGGAVVLAGLVTLIVGVVRRSSRRPGPPGGYGPPGQYGPPGGYGPGRYGTPPGGGWPPAQG